MKNIILSALALFCMHVAGAQLKVAVTYPIAFPVGDLSDYIDATSFRGISLELYKNIKPNVAVGLETSWSLFYAREDEKVYTEGTASISGVQYRYTNAVPILAMGKFFKPSANKPVVPFGGLGVGTLFINRYADFGLYRVTNDTWQFCLRPELGIVIKGRDSNGPGVLVAAKYYAGFNTDDLEGQSYFSINIGLAFR
ncbi:MAG TPA: hypothetical protein VFZ42_17310 [Chitinophagaceae bacterium]